MLGLGHRTSTCPQCDSEVDGLATWCGRCGAALSEGDALVVARGAVPRPDAPPPRRIAPSRPRGRLLVTGALLLAVVVGVVVARPPAVGETLIGRLDVGAGPVATQAPPRDLGVAWRQQLEAGFDGPDYVGGAGPPVGGTGPLVVRDGRAVVGGVVVDVATGAVVADLRGSSLGRSWSAQGTTAVAHGDRLLVVDVLTGEIVHRHRLDAAVLAQPGQRVESVARARATDSTLFASWPRPRGWLARDEEVVWSLVGDDGDVLAHGAGDPLTAGGDASGPPEHAVVSLPRWDQTGADLRVAAWVVLDLDTGAEVLRVEPTGAWPAPPQVLGGTALVLGQDDSAQSWDVARHDLHTRRVRWRTQLPADEPPVLHAVTSSGDVVVATRAGPVLRVQVIDRKAGSTVVAAVSAPDPAAALVPSAAALVAADGEEVVLLDAVRGELVATGLDGEPRWRTPVGALPADALVDLDMSGDLVALSVDGGSGQLLQLVDRATGEVLHRIAPGRHPPALSGDLGVTASVDGLVGIDGDPRDVSALGGWAPSRELGFTDWFDVRTGGVRAPAAVVDWSLRGVDLPPSLATAAGAADVATFLLARFSGTVEDSDGRIRPVLVWPEHDGSIDLLIGRALFSSVALPTDARNRAWRWDVAAVAGDAVVLQGAQIDDVPVTIRFDRGTGSTASLPPVWPVGVAGSVLVGQREAGDGSTSLVGHDLADGDLRWEAPWTWADVVVTDDHHVVTLAGGDVIVRRPDDGTVAWRTELDELVAGEPVLTRRSVLLRTLHGAVVALDRDDGSVAWRHDTGHPVTALGGAGDDALLGTADGVVIHLDAVGREVQRIDAGLGPVAAVASMGHTVVVTLPDAVVGLRSGVTGIAPQDEVDLP